MDTVVHLSQPSSWPLRRYLRTKVHNLTKTVMDNYPPDSQILDSARA